MRGILAPWLSRSLAAVGLVAILALAAQLDARRGEAAIITEFVISTGNSGPYGIARGPDGNLWFTEEFGSKIGRITPTGTIGEFVIPTASSFPVGITAGPDGNLWFTEGAGNKIGQLVRASVPPPPSKRLFVPIVFNRAQ